MAQILTEQPLLIYNDSLGNGAALTVLLQCASCSKIVCSALGAETRLFCRILQNSLVSAPKANTQQLVHLPHTTVCLFGVGSHHIVLVMLGVVCAAISVDHH